MAIGQVAEKRRAHEDAEERRSADEAGRQGVEVKTRRQRDQRQADAAQNISVAEDAGVGVDEDRVRKALLVYFAALTVAPNGYVRPPIVLLGLPPAG
jgi:hypothetical protein